MDKAQWSAITTYLDTRGHVLDKNFVPRMLSGGAANLNYLIAMNGRRAVLRRPPDGPLPPGANDVKREFRLLSSLGDEFPKAPRGLLFCDDESVIGVPFCISEFREGVCIGRHLPPEFAARRGIGGSLSRCVVDTLIELHLVDVKKAGLEELGKVDGYLERQIAGWSKRGERVLLPEQLERLELAGHWLHEHLPSHRPSALVHNDFKLDNMLIDADSLKAPAVLDWDMATIGDPLYELAILLAYWGEKNDAFVLDYQCRMPKESEGWWSRKQVIQEYILRTRASLADQNMRFYWNLAQYRSIVVYAQLNSAFKRTGERPSSLTQEECDAMSDHVDDALTQLITHLDSSPPL